MSRFYYWIGCAWLLSMTFSLLPQESAVEARSIRLRPPLTADELIAEVNALRASNGLPAYNMNSILMQIAQQHANYQAAIGSGTHYSADGSRPFQRALAAGYPVAGDLSRGGFFSENIIWGTNMTPGEAVSAWQGDAPHLNTMLSPNLQDVGAGVANSGGMTFYTLDAGLASGSPVNYTPPAGGISGLSGTEIVSEFMQPVALSTPDESGDIYHEVQFGQTLWSLAIAYETTVEQLKQVNKLPDINIFEGQKLLIKSVPTPTATEDKTVRATATFGIPTSNATQSLPPTPTNTPLPKAPVSSRNSGLVVIVIVVAALLTAGLGTWIGTRKPE